MMQQLREGSSGTGTQAGATTDGRDGEKACGGDSEVAACSPTTSITTSAASACSHASPTPSSRMLATVAAGPLGIGAACCQQHMSPRKAALSSMQLQALLVSKRITFVAARIGKSVATTVASMAVSGAATSASLLGRTVASNALVAGTMQLEAVQWVVIHISLVAPESMQSFLSLITAYCSIASHTTSAARTACSYVSGLTALQQVTVVGLHGTAASILATAAVQLSLTAGCFVLGRVSGPQLKHDGTTILLCAASSVAGGVVGAACGSIILPGIGTALGSLLGNFTFAYLPLIGRSKGPDYDPEYWKRLERKQIEKVQRARKRNGNPERPLDLVEREDDWVEIVEVAPNSEFALFEVVPDELATPSPESGEYQPIPSSDARSSSVKSGQVESDRACDPNPQSSPQNSSDGTLVPAPVPAASMGPGFFALYGRALRTHLGRPGYALRRWRTSRGTATPEWEPLDAEAQTTQRAAADTSEEVGATPSASVKNAPESPDVSPMSSGRLFMVERGEHKSVFQVAEDVECEEYDVVLFFIPTEAAEAASLALGTTTGTETLS